MNLSVFIFSALLPIGGCHETAKVPGVPTFLRQLVQPSLVVSDQGALPAVRATETLAADPSSPSTWPGRPAAGSGLGLPQDLLTHMERDRDESIFRQVWQDCLKSLFFFGSLLIGIVLLGSLARWLGLALFTIFALVTLKDILRLLMAIGIGVLVLPFTIMAAFKIAPISGEQGFGNEFHLLNANAVILMQLFVLLGYNLYLYSHFFTTNNPVFP